MSWKFLKAGRVILSVLVVYVVVVLLSLVEPEGLPTDLAIVIGLLLVGTGLTLLVKERTRVSSQKK